jgi:hypothetical protein
MQATIYGLSLVSYTLVGALLFVYLVVPRSMPSWVRHRLIVLICVTFLVFVGSLTLHWWYASSLFFLDLVFLSTIVFDRLGKLNGSVKFEGSEW